MKKKEQENKILEFKILLNLQTYLILFTLNQKFNKA